MTPEEGLGVEKDALGEPMTEDAHDSPLPREIAPTTLGIALSQGTYDSQPSSPSPYREIAPNTVVPPSHVLPPGFRGPIPRDSDAETFAPLPSFVPVHENASLGNVTNFPMNKGGWRYTAAGPAAHWLPKTVFRSLEFLPDGVHWSWQDRSAFTRISQNAMTLGVDKGFRSARTNVGVRHGAWYVEIEVLPPDASSLPATPMRDGPHARVGFGRREASLNAPVGWDAYSYGYRDQNGAKVTCSRPAPFGRAFGVGDVVGMYIRLPPSDAPLFPGTEHQIHQKRIPIRYRGQLYFESLEYPVTKEMDAVMDKARHGEDAVAPSKSNEREEKRPARSTGASQPLRPLPVLPESCIGFVVNGAPQGIAFTHLYDFRPLCAHPSVAKGKREKKRGEGANSTPEPVITQHTSVSTIMRSRQNAFDDGTLGYYPMVSLYGGARARLITREFVFPPPADLEDQLWGCTAQRGENAVHKSAAPLWRPLEDRFQEHLAELEACDARAEQDTQPDNSD
ncbi:transcription factor, contains a PHD finger motif [Malassezia vespertilionis]|uniref:B30.2/SPRY domain-containing protein n=1 Tax=Malassezia vespertilionis TaxID=2020962 RepID=A0A2N1JF58_9BASI|nr:transcription factor, contains a PHD finger motif [Malassezia vespertilionis]PKI85197.1 hypothetical protein MVES_001022 [Malassezia vespertilionis]WFD05753.1 transcription factor, contains a PHD finger motif [Malassezia vespertilionis]